MSEATPHTTATRVPFWQRKATLILFMILAALAVFGTTTQTWIHVAIAQGGVAQSDLDIAGNKAAVAVSALALVALAGSLATTIAGKMARIVTGCIVFLSAAGIVAVVLGIVLDPAAAAMTEVGAATGVEGVPSDATTTIFPILAIVAAAVLALVTLLTLWVGRGWKVRTKYDAAKATGEKDNEGPIDEIDHWDRLSRGEDPTE